MAALLPPAHSNGDELPLHNDQPVHGQFSSILQHTYKFEGDGWQAYDRALILAQGSRPDIRGLGYLGPSPPQPHIPGSGQEGELL